MLLTPHTSSAASCLNDCRPFLFEVVGLRQNAETANFKSSIRRSGRLSFVVPYSRMSRELRRIARLGGRIVNIRPLQGDRPEGDWTATDLGWWLEISTQNPSCTLFFGPYDSVSEAQSQQPGYVEDLSQEGAEGIASQVKWCQPKQLTVSEAVGV